MVTVPDNPRTPELAESRKLDAQRAKELKRIADEAAAKARKTEKLYDRQHGTFPRGGPSGMA